MQSDNFSHEYVSQLRCSDRGLGRSIMTHLSQLINEYDDDVIVRLRTRQLSDQVHIHLLPWSMTDWPSRRLFDGSFSSCLLHHCQSLGTGSSSKEGVFTVFLAIGLLDLSQSACS